MKKILFILILIGLYNIGKAQRVKTPNTQSQSFVRFTENKKQWDSKVNFKAQLDGGALFIEKSGNLMFHLYDKDNYRARHLGRELSPNLKYHAYSINFIGANSSPQIISNNSYDDYANYFLGNNQQNWSTNVHHYKTVTTLNLYNGIDALYNGGKQSIKYNFLVHPNGKPENIKMNYQGVKSIKLKNGELYISTSVSESIEQKPFVYQIINGDTVEIPSKFILEKNTVSFKLLNDYDHTIDLIIDPLLVFAASSGSTADNFGMTATYDEHGNLYTGGTAFDIGYPTTIGAYDVSYNGNAIDGFTDVVITKYDSTGTFLRYSTYLGGGTSSEIVTSLVVDGADNLCLYGATGSTDFPTTTGCFDATFNGGQFLHYPQNGTLFGAGTDMYVAKFNSLGTQLIASTYLGGSANDGVNNNNNTSLYDSLMFNYGDQFRGEIQVDKLNNIYIASSTKSPNFPMVNAIDGSLNGAQDGILVKLNTNLTAIIYSTFIGGNNKDCSNALAIDDSLNVYITGGTCSSNFYTTTGSYKPTYNGGKADGYICKIKYDGSSILYSTFIGTASYDQSYFVQLDNNFDVYIFGQTQGVMPVTSGTYANLNSRQFIQKFNNQLNTLLASTVIGNSNGQINISPSAFSVDCAGNIYLSGWGGNILAGSSGVFNMPITANTIQGNTDGHNFYIMALGPNMSNLLFGSYFGGNTSWEHVDGGTSRFDKKGIIYQSVCAGCQSNDDFPVSPGAWPTAVYGADVNQSGNCNNGVFKIDFELNSAHANISSSALSGCAPLTVTLTNISTPGHSYLWDFGNNDTISQIFNPIKTFTAVGSYTVNLYVKTSICNNLYDTATVIINVLPVPISLFTATSSVCSNTVITLNNSSGQLGTNPYIWNWGDSSPTSTLTSPAHTYTTSGTFTVQLTTTATNGCFAKSTQTVTVFNFSTTINSPTICLGSTANINVSGGTSYTWQPTALVSNTAIANPSTSPLSTTIYTVQINNNASGNLCSKTLTTQVTVNPNIIADFNFIVFPCTDSVTFNNTSTTLASNQTFTWNFGTGLPISTSAITTQTFNTGNYTVTLVAQNNFGCIDSIKKIINVLNFEPNIAYGDSICKGFTATLNASGGTSYTWNPSLSLNNSLISNPVATPSATTIYSVIIQNNSFGNTCSTTLTTSVFVYPQIISLFTYSIGVCGNNVQFTDASVVSPIKWSWNFGDNSYSNLQNQIHYYYTSGTYTASLVSENAFGCKDTSEQIIILPTFPPLSVNSLLTKCQSDNIQLNANGGVFYQWSPAATLSNANIPNPIASPTITTIYTVTIVNYNGLDTCKSLLTTTVNINPFSYNASSIAVSATTLTLGQSSTVTLNGFNYSGNITVLPSTNITVISNTVFVINPTKTGEYSIYYTEPGGCKFLLKTIYVEVITNDCNEGVVYLPTGFTPNNDGHNDILFIRSNFISEVYLAIYNRWGEKIFETNDIKIGWDGYYKGKLLDQGVYGYYLTFKCNNGEQSFKKGNITLMR